MQWGDVVCAAGVDVGAGENEAAHNDRVGGTGEGCMQRRIARGVRAVGIERCAEVDEQGHRVRAAEERGQMQRGPAIAAAEHAGVVVVLDGDAECVEIPERGGFPGVGGPSAQQRRGEIRGTHVTGVQDQRLPTGGACSRERGIFPEHPFNRDLVMAADGLQQGLGCDRRRRHAAYATVGDRRAPPVSPWAQQIRLAMHVLA